MKKNNEVSIVGNLPKGIVINQAYKPILQEIKSYDLDDFSKLALLLQELSGAKKADGEMLIDDWSTIAFAVFDLLQLNLKTQN